MTEGFLNPRDIQRRSAAEKGTKERKDVMRNEGQRKEINEARAAGRSALNSLRQAREQLESARNWGIFDMLGGGFFSTLVKHSKLDDASRLMEDARRKLRIFQRELQDVQVPLEFRMDIGDFLTFADFFFDGLIADWMVQSRIGEAREQVEDAIARVERILHDLDTMEAAIDVDYREV